MFCMNCGTQLPDGAKFCMNCGTKVGEVGAGAVPSGKKYPSYAMLYPNSMAYLESPAYQRERGLMKQSELGATPYAGFDFTNYVALDDGTMVGFVFGHTARYRAAEDFGYNLYRLNPDGTAVFLNAGCSRASCADRTVCAGRKSALDGEWRSVFRIYLSIKAPGIRCSYFLHDFS